ncbi:hypothetical protein ACF0H5_012255 [Mactra antiquata]
MLYKVQESRDNMLYEVQESRDNMLYKVQESRDNMLYKVQESRDNMLYKVQESRDNMLYKVQESRDNMLYEVQESRDNMLYKVHESRDNMLYKVQESRDNMLYEVQESRDNMLYKVQESRDNMLYKVQESRDNMLYEVQESRDNMLYKVHESRDNMLYKVQESRDNMLYKTRFRATRFTKRLVHTESNRHYSNIRRNDSLELSKRADLENPPMGILKDRRKSTKTTLAEKYAQDCYQKKQYLSSSIPDINDLYRKQPITPSHSTSSQNHIPDRNELLNIKDMVSRLPADVLSMKKQLIEKDTKIEADCKELNEINSELKTCTNFIAESFETNPDVRDNNSNIVSLNDNKYAEKNARKLDIKDLFENIEVQISDIKSSPVSKEELESKVKTLNSKLKSHEIKLNSDNPSTAVDKSRKTFSINLCEQFNSLGKRLEKSIGSVSKDIQKSLVNCYSSHSKICNQIDSTQASNVDRINVPSNNMMLRESPDSSTLGISCDITDEISDQVSQSMSHETTRHTANTPRTQTVDIDSDRLCAIKMVLPHITTIVLQVYLPSVNNGIDIFKETVDQMNDFCAIHTDSNIIVMGDFNSRFTDSLRSQDSYISNFASSFNLVPIIDSHICAGPKYTFFPSNDANPTCIDHILVDEV